MDEQTMRVLEERLTRLEAAVSQASAARPGFSVPPGTVVDPAPWAGGGVVVDPAPYPWRHYPWRYPFPSPSPVADPAPDPFTFAGGFTVRRPQFGPIGDPPPIDISRLSAAQLQSTLHNINAERARLDGLEEMVQKQLDQLNQG